MACDKLYNNNFQLDPWKKKDNKTKHVEDKKNKSKASQKNIFSDIRNFFYHANKILMKKGDTSNTSKKQVNPLIMIIFITFSAWFGNGFYIVKEGERGVVTHLGQFSHIVEPGLHWRPILINEVKIINVKNIRELSISDKILTSDENIVNVKANIQYKISDPANYLFSIASPDNSFLQAAESALRTIIGCKTMDNILVLEHSQIRRDTQSKLENIIKPYRMGITILDVNFPTIRPPEEVMSSFNKVIASFENREQYIKKARFYVKLAKLKAHRKAQQILTKAKSYASKMILQAEGEVAHFSKILPAYKIAKNITLKRLYLETMERIFNHNKKIFFDTSNFPMIFFNTKSISEHKNSKQNYSSELSLNNILEKRCIDALRNAFQNTETKKIYE